MAKRSAVAARTGKRPEDFSFERKAFYSPAEVARILGVSDQTVLDLVHEDRLFAVQI
ncbi:MAG: helix-turn-helix domain-containing protein, partial [Chloroflexi bacterium]